MNRKIKIANREIGCGEPVYVIAEAGVNHNGSLDLAKELIHAAATAGCDAVKFQTYSIDDLVSPSAPMADYQQRNTGSEGSQANLLRRCWIGRQEHEELIAECKRQGITFLSTPFDRPSLHLLIELDVPGLKISSGDLTNLPFLDEVGRAGRPVILSTGMGTYPEVQRAVDVLRKAGCAELAVLHCVSAYPTPPEDCHLRVIPKLAGSLGCHVGFSDHTQGYDITTASVAIGAAIIEKHLTIDRNLPGPDHAASLEPEELKAMVISIRRIQQALGSDEKRPSDEEIRTARVVRKSLHLARSLPAGAALKISDLVALRPGHGLSPERLPDVVGRTVKHDLEAGQMLSLEMLE